MSIYKEILYTYNTNFLENLDINKKKEIKNISKHLITKNTKYIVKNYNKILTTLIYNYFYLEKPVYPYISGPINCSLWKSDEYKKYIYVFGELHGHKNNCIEKKFEPNISITEYLQKLFLTTDVFIDFFLEIDNSIDYKDGKKYIDSLRYNFVNCINPEKRNKKECQLGRVHYVDIRDFNKMLVRYDLVFTTKNEKLIDYLIFKNEYTKKMLNLFSKGIEETKRFFLNSYYREIYKLKKRKQSYLYNTINKFCINIMYKSIDKTYIEENIQEYSRDILSYINNQDMEKWRINNRFSNIAYFASSIHTAVMDVYTLCRIFRQFETKNNEQPIEPSNIIIYTGDYHSSVYRKFFEENGFECIEKSGEFDITDRNRCLDMTGIKQPLFTHK